VSQCVDQEDDQYQWETNEKSDGNRGILKIEIAIVFECWDVELNIHNAYFFSSFSENTNSKG